MGQEYPDDENKYKRQAITEALQLITEKNVDEYKEILIDLLGEEYARAYFNKLLKK